MEIKNNRRLLIFMLSALGLLEPKTALADTLSINNNSNNAVLQQDSGIITTKISNEALEDSVKKSPHKTDSIDWHYKMSDIDIITPDVPVLGMLGVEYLFKAKEVYYKKIDNTSTTTYETRVNIKTPPFFKNIDVYFKKVVDKKSGAEMLIEKDYTDKSEIVYAKINDSWKIVDINSNSHNANKRFELPYEDFFTSAEELFKGKETDLKFFVDGKKISLKLKAEMNGDYTIIKPLGRLSLKTISGGYINLNKEGVPTTFEIQGMKGSARYVIRFDLIGSK